jgi:hypothetical protein
MTQSQKPIARRRIVPALLQALSAIPLFVTAPLYRRWHLRWGATDVEVAGAMPGDDIVPDPSFNATRAITIEAPPEAVWPWIVQMGYRRAGFYSYDLFDNAGYDSADRVLPDHQEPKVGDWMPMASKVNDTTAFKVKGFAVNEWLLWEKPDSTWAWKLIPLEGGRTRLIVRLKAKHPWPSPGAALLSVFLLEIGDFPMMRKAMQGIKARAEHAQPAADASSGPAGRDPSRSAV